MTITVEIDGVEYNAADNYSVRQQAGAISTTNIDIKVEPGQSVPVSLAALVFKVDGVAQFTGIIQTVDSPGFSTSKEVARYRVTVKSKESIFSNRLVSEAFENKLTHEIVASLFTNYIAEEGITLGTVSVSTLNYENYNCSYTKLSDVLDELADDIGASYYVDANDVFHFITRDTFVQVDAPEAITGLAIAEDATDVRTVQIVTGASEETSTQTEGAFWLEDQTAWVLGYQVSAVLGFTINGVIVGYGIKGIDESDTSKTFLYEVGSNSITLNSSATTKPETGDEAVIVYKGFYDVVVTTTNDALVGEISGLNGTSGKIESVYTDETIDNYQDADSKASSLLGQYGERTKEVTCSTRDLESTELYTMWQISRPDLNIEGQFVVVERTISAFGPNEFWIKVKLKNKGFFSRYGTTLKTTTKTKGATTKVYKTTVFGDSVSVSDSVQIDHCGLLFWPTDGTLLTDPELSGFYPLGDSC